MTWIITRGALFFLGGCLGWLLELLFRRFVSQKRWVNPGFLTGPCLPLYGFGFFFFFTLGSIDYSTWTPYPWLNITFEILLIGASLTLIEYIAGLIFIKGMKIKLWDYSSRPGNIQGIICPLFSIMWLAAAGIYVGVGHPLLVKFVEWVNSVILPMGLVIGVCLGILFVDFGWSIGLAAKIRKAVNDSKLVVDWERIKITFQEKAHNLKERMNWAFAFDTHKHFDFREGLNDYLRLLNEETQARLALRNAKRAKKKESHSKKDK